MRDAGRVFVGSMTANLAGYLLQLAAGRMLGAAGYGAFASLLAIQLLCAVPALGVQPVVARETVRGTATVRVRHSVWRACLATVAVAAAGAPVVAGLLHVSFAAATAAMASAPCLVLLAGEQGLRQGQRKFAQLAALTAAGGSLRAAAAIGVLASGAGLSATLAAAAAGTATVALAGRLRTPATPWHATVANPRQTGGEVFAAARTQLALLTLASLDVIAARMLLPGADAGRYALGTVVAKAALWLPQAVVTVGYPRMADPAARPAAVRGTVRTVAGLGALLVLGTAAATPLAPLLAGPDYRDATGLLWLFAADGALLAVAQVLLLAGVAEAAPTPLAGVWLVAAGETAALAFWAHTPTRMVLAAVVGAAAAVAAVAAQTRGINRVRSSESASPPPSGVSVG